VTSSKKKQAYEGLSKAKARIKSSGHNGFRTRSMGKASLGAIPFSAVTSQAMFNEAGI
jgi:hypothetical protein